MTRLLHRFAFGRGDGATEWVFDDKDARAKGVFQGAFTGMGASGQYLTVIPKLDMAIAHKTKPAQGRDVSYRQYRTLIRQLVDARTGVDRP